jgi:protein SCO1
MEISVKRTATPFGRIQHLWLCASLILTLISCKEEAKQSVPFYKDASFTPVWNPSSEGEDSLHRVGAFKFINQLNETVTHQTFQGKVHLVSFFFTACPSICPKLTNTMKQVFEHFRGNNEVLFLSHSVTPERDSVKQLYQFAQKNGVLSKQWHFVTGSRTEIYGLARKGYFIEEKIGLSKADNQFLHTENFVLVDQKGHIRGLYNGTLEAEVPRIIQDIELLIH